MDLDKFAMLKATVKQVSTISVGYVKNILNVDEKEAEEMIQKLAQAGAIDPFPFDGINYLVRR